MQYLLPAGCMSEESTPLVVPGSSRERIKPPMQRGDRKGDRQNARYGHNPAIYKPLGFSHVLVEKKDGKCVLLC